MSSLLLTAAYLFLVLSLSGARDKKSFGAAGRVAVSSHRKENSSTQKAVLQPGEDMEAVVADALVSSGLFLILEITISCISR